MLGKKEFGFDDPNIFAIVGTIRKPISTGIRGIPNCKSSMPKVYLKSGDMSDSPGTLNTNPTAHNNKLTSIFFLLYTNKQNTIIKM
tara:strand:- start:24 stop:281 length:258 start_codon:yes stop_codon:yes gene_type:complete